MAAPCLGLVRLLLPCWLLLAEARLETGTVHFGAAKAEEQWHYVGKFGYAIGAGTYDVRLRAHDQNADTSARLDVFLDEHWPRVSALPPCSSEARQFARKKHVLRVGEEWSAWSGGSVQQNVRSHIWYFALSRCGPANATFGIDFELRSQQHDGSDLSVELQYMPSATLLAVLLLTGFLCRFAVRCRRFREDAGVLHPVIKVLAVAVLLQWTAQVLHLLHLVVNEVEGITESAMETSADVLFMLTQVVSSALLIMIARGYTLLSLEGRELEHMRSVVAAVAVLHVVLVGHGKWQGDHAEKHHDHEGMAGYALVATRVLMYAWFLDCLRRLRRCSGALRLQCFLQNFQIAGSLYFMSYPSIFLVVQVLAPYLRHPALHLGLVAMQTASAFWLGDLFLTRGAFYQVSSLSSSLLPFGFGFGTVDGKQA